MTVVRWETSFAPSPQEAEAAAQLSPLVPGSLLRHVRTLLHTERALPAIRQLLAELAVPERSWLLFHDCERRTEWVGAYDDTPPPPLREEE